MNKKAMMNLSTKLMGLTLKNPIIVASSSLTKNPDKVAQCEDAGAGAVVLKSIFEEEIESDVESLLSKSSPQFHVEEADYIREMGKITNTDEYLSNIEKCKERVDIPVIASLNCVSKNKWVEFSKYIEAVGADAIELNIALMPRDFDESPTQIEKNMCEIVSAVKHEVNIPISVKMGPYFTSIPKVAKNLRKAGASALVMFNRFYQTDIDIYHLAFHSKNRYSSPAEMSNTLRWISILYKQIGCSLIANTGIHTASDMIKQIMVGAKAVEIASTLYLNRMGHIQVMLKGLEEWMLENDFETLDDFRGMLSQKLTSQPEYFERLQYIKALTGTE